jgi:Tetratricopeptide repeat
MKIPAQLRLADNRAERLLPHVLEATAHAQRLRAVPDRAVRLLTTVGSSLRDVGQLDTSPPVLDRALAVARTQLGPGYPGTLTARGGLAWWLGEAGQPAQAADQFRGLLDDYPAGAGTRPPRHPHRPRQPGLLAGQGGGWRRLSWRRATSQRLGVAVRFWERDGSGGPCAGALN